MNSIDLLRTLTDEELIAFIIMMSDKNAIEHWTFDVFRAKKFVKTKKETFDLDNETFEMWKRSLLNESDEEEIKIYRGEYK